MSKLMYDGLKLGMEELGAIHVKTDSEAIYYDIPKDVEVTDEGLLNMSKAYLHYTGLKLKIKRIKQ